VKVVLASRFPFIDVLAWKRRIAAELLHRGVELLVLHSRQSPGEQLRYAMATLRERRSTPQSASPPAQSSRRRLALAHSPRASLHHWARRRGVRTLTTGRLDDARCIDGVRAFESDAMLLLGADIVPPLLLEQINGPTLNPHFGLLPDYRGMNVTEWAIFNDDPVGVSVHTVDAGIDTGAIVERVRIPVRRGDDLDSIRERQRRAGGDSLLAAIDALREGRLATVEQDVREGRQYYRMHPRLRAAVVDKLRRGEYRWLGSQAGDLAGGAAAGEHPASAALRV
jgi:folate-dependent phosphoribosylglycinamide formyltransferase PurN